MEIFAISRTYYLPDLIITKPYQLRCVQKIPKDTLGKNDSRIYTIPFYDKMQILQEDTIWAFRNYNKLIIKFSGDRYCLTLCAVFTNKTE